MERDRYSLEFWGEIMGVEASDDQSCKKWKEREEEASVDPAAPEPPWLVNNRFE